MNCGVHGVMIFVEMSGNRMMHYPIHLIGIRGEGNSVGRISVMMIVGKESRGIVDVNGGMMGRHSTC